MPSCVEIGPPVLEKNTEFLQRSVPNNTQFIFKIDFKDDNSCSALRLSVDIYNNKSHMFVTVQ